MLFGPSLSRLDPDGTWFAWKVIVQPPPSHFEHDGSATITIKEEGAYHIFVHYSMQCSVKVVLNVNGTDVARDYHAFHDSDTYSSLLQSIQKLKAGDKLQVKYCSDYTATEDLMEHFLTIVLI